MDLHDQKVIEVAMALDGIEVECCPHTEHWDSRYSHELALRRTNVERTSTVVKRMQSSPTYFSPCPRHLPCNWEPPSYEIIQQ